jgi:hypothetical protein
MSSDSGVTTINDCPLIWLLARSAIINSHARDVDPANSRSQEKNQQKIKTIGLFARKLVDFTSRLTDPKPKKTQSSVLHFTTHELLTCQAVSWCLMKPCAECCRPGEVQSLQELRTLTGNENARKLKHHIARRTGYVLWLEILSNTCAAQRST